MVRIVGICSILEPSSSKERFFKTLFGRFQCWALPEEPQGPS